MKKTIERTSRYKTSSPRINQLIEELVGPASESTVDSYLREMITTVLKLREDEVELGDLKLINTTLKELRYSFNVFEPYRHIRKVAIFGSARTPKKDPSYRQARDFAREIVKKGWMVITGASSGIMNAGNEGAGRENSFGVNIRLPFEQDANTVIRGDRKLINYKYFFTRKLVFVRESDATVLCPGGFGTHDEGFETLTLVQTGKANPRPIICLDPSGSHYWEGWRQFVEQELGRGKMIDPDDIDLVDFTHDAAEAARIIEQFYRHYHSMRFIREKIVLRIKQPISRKLLMALNREFKDLLAEGSICQQKGPFEEEHNEPHTLHLARLFFHFNRRHLVRLKKMIERINLEA